MEYELLEMPKDYLDMFVETIEIKSDFIRYRRNTKTNKYLLNANEAKVVLYLISCVEDNDYKNKSIKLSNEFITNNFCMNKEQIGALIHKKISFAEDNNKTLEVKWFNARKTKVLEDGVLFRLNTSLLEHIIPSYEESLMNNDVKKITFQLGMILPFNEKYTYYFYEHCLNNLENRNKKITYYEIQTLKNMFMDDDETYEHFQNKTLQNVINEINNFTDLNVQIKILKRKNDKYIEDKNLDDKNVCGIVFVTQKKQNEELAETPIGHILLQLSIMNMSKEAIQKIFNNEAIN